MATVQYADNYKTEPPASNAGTAGLVVARTFIYTITAATVLQAGDTIKLMMLQGQSLPGFLFLGFVIDIPDLDSGSGIVLNLGDDDTADKFVTTAAMGTIGQVAGRISSVGAVSTGSNTVVAGATYGSLPVEYTSNKSLILTVTVNASSEATSGTIKGIGYYAQFGINSF